MAGSDVCSSRGTGGLTPSMSFGCMNDPSISCHSENDGLERVRRVERGADLRTKGIAGERSVARDVGLGVSSRRSEISAAPALPYPFPLETRRPDGETYGGFGVMLVPRPLRVLGVRFSFVFVLVRSLSRRRL